MARKKTTSPVNRFDNMSDADLADMHGALGTGMHKLEAERKEITQELLRRGSLPVNGNAYRAIQIEPYVQWSVDRGAIELAMGTQWLTKYMKQKLVSATVKTSVLAPALSELAVNTLLKAA